MSGTAYWFIRTQTTYDVAIPTVARSQADFNRDVSYAFSAMAGGTGVVGELLYKASGNAMAGYILCDGQAISRTGYSELFAEIGTDWGAGDGSTTFNIPTQSGLSGLVATPPPVPPQVIDSTTVSSGTVITNPTSAGQTGGTSGAGRSSGGRPPDLP